MKINFHAANAVLRYLFNPIQMLVQNIAFFIRNDTILAFFS